MGFEPMTFRTPGGCFTNWATRTPKGARPITGFCRWYMDCDLPTAGSTSPKYIYVSTIPLKYILCYTFFFQYFQLIYFHIYYFANFCFVLHRYCYYVYYVLVAYLTTIPRTRVGYELLYSGRGAEHRVGYHNLTSNKCEWNNCLIKYRTLEKISGILFSSFRPFWRKIFLIKLSDAIIWTNYRI